MARTNAFICDRCGKVTKNDKHWQVMVRHKSWLGADWRKPIDLCDSCYTEFRYFIDPSEAPVPVTVMLKTQEDGAGLNG